MPKVVRKLPEESKRLKLLRKHLNINQVEMCLHLGLQQGSYSDIERGKNSLTTKHLKILVQKFKLNPIWFLLGEENMFIDEKKEVIEISEQQTSNEDLKDLTHKNQKLLLQVHSLERENKTLQKLVELLEKQLEG